MALIHKRFSNLFKRRERCGKYLRLVHNKHLRIYFEKSDHRIADSCCKFANVVLLIPIRGRMKILLVNIISFHFALMKRTELVVNCSLPTISSRYSGTLSRFLARCERTFVWQFCLIERDVLLWQIHRLWTAYRYYVQLKNTVHCKVSIWLQSLNMIWDIRNENISIQRSCL